LIGEVLRTTDKRVQGKGHEADNEQDWLLTGGRPGEGTGAKYQERPKLLNAALSREVQGIHPYFNRYSSWIGEDQQTDRREP
jgi:hypothetical protein